MPPKSDRLRLLLREDNPDDAELVSPALDDSAFVSPGGNCYRRGESPS